MVSNISHYREDSFKVIHKKMPCKFITYCRRNILLICCINLIVLNGEVQANSDDYLTDIQASETAFNRGNYDDVIRILSRVINKSALPVDIRLKAYEHRGSAYCLSGRYGLAITDLSTGIELMPNEATAYFARGTCYITKGDYDRAIKDLDEAIKLKPDYAAAFGNRANAYKFKGNSDNAESDYSTAISMQPNNPLYRYNRGLLYLETKRYNNALIDFNDSLRLDPHDIEALHQRGVLYENIGNNDRAIEDFNEEIRLDPKRFMAYLRLGNIYANRRDNIHAIKEYSQSINLKSDDAEALCRRGSLYFLEDEYARAIADFDALSNSKGKCKQAHIIRGVAHFVLGQFDEAAADFVEELKNEPKSIHAIIWLHISRKKLGKDDINELRHNASNLNQNTGAGLLLAMYLGKVTPDHVRAAVIGDDMNKTQHCEAAFYIGEYELERNNLSDAKLLFQLTADQCPKERIEKKAAVAELKRTFSLRNE